MSQRTVEIDEKKEHGNICVKRRLNSHATVVCSNNGTDDKFSTRQSLKSVCHLPESRMGYLKHNNNTNRSRPSRFTDDLSSDNSTTTRFVPNKKILPRYHNLSSRLILHRGEKGIRTRHFMQQMRNQSRNNNNNNNNFIKNQQNRQFSPVSTLSTASTSSLPDESLLEADLSPNTKNKVAFLESYIITLKNQILYKDKKLHRLQREHPMFSEDNKDKLLQSSWDRHDELFRKYKTLEADQKLLVMSKEKLEDTVKELESLNENQSKEKEIAEQTIKKLQEELSQMESVKLEFQNQIKQYYEQELHKKLQDYQLQCFEYVKQAIRPYQIKLQTVEMQMSQIIGGRPIGLQNIMSYSNGLCPQSASLGMVVNDSANTTTPSSTMTLSRIFDGGVLTTNNNRGSGESTNSDESSRSSTLDQISTTNLKFLSEMNRILNH